MRIVKLQLGLTPRAGTGLRVYAHRFDRDRGDPSAFAYEHDVVVDQAVGGRWTGWLMGGLVTPPDAARAAFAGARSGQVFASVSYKFGGPLGAAR